MSGCCSHSACDASAASPRFRQALWIALIVNAAMFLVEFVAGLAAGSVALWADALDFAGDAANYALSLTVLSWGLMWRARAALLKGVAMALFGTVVMARALWAFQQGITPEPLTMGAVGVLALVANAGVALMLYRFRGGDANMRSVWLCSRNDAIGNLAVILAAVGVFGTGSALPDLIVALVMSGLALWSGLLIIVHARRDMADAEQAQP
ncbi:cation transporter (plasmid) [Thauera butanivorans]|uniref:cation transporter n=1 Tax=Thauera butanivorans TaxID=86174 RepID=UPI003AB7A5B2